MNEKIKMLEEKIMGAIEGIWANYYKEEGINDNICPLEVLPYLDNIEEIADMIYRAGESNKTRTKES